MNFGNLHALAAQAVPQNKLILTRFKGVTTNAMGYHVPEYHDPVTIYGSIQPMAAQDVTKLGLDFRQRYAQLYTREQLKLSEAGTQPDKLEYKGQAFEVVGITDWHGQDAWAEYVLVAL